eukprot:5761343-Pyramimonas_sp.AAC.1
MQAVQTQISSLSRAPTSYDSGSSDSGRRVARRLTAPELSENSGRQENRVWLRGFPREMMASAFKKHFSQISTAYPSLANAECKPANGKFTYPILFPTAELAKSFIAEARENTPFWMDS